MFSSTNFCGIVLPYLQRGGSQQRREYTVICNLFAASTANLKLFRLLIVIVLLLLGVAYFRRFCSTRIATRTLPLATVSTVFPRAIVTLFAALIPRGTVFVTAAAAATSATVSAIATTATATSVSPSVVAIVRATAIAADRVVLLRFCIESQA